MKINKILMLMVTSSLILGSVGCGEKKNSKTNNTYVTQKATPAMDSRSATSKDQHRINDDMKTGRIRDEQKVATPSGAVAKKEITKTENSDKDTHRTSDDMKMGRMRDEQKPTSVSTESAAKPQTVTPKESTPKNDLLNKDLHRVSDDMRIGRNRDEQKTPATTVTPATKNECTKKECNVKSEALDKDLHRVADEMKVGRIRDEQSPNANTPKVTPKTTNCKNCKQHKACKNSWLDVEQHRINDNKHMGTHRQTEEVCSNSDRKRIRKFHQNNEFDAQYLWGAETIRGF